MTTAAIIFVAYVCSNVSPVGDPGTSNRVKFISPAHVFSTLERPSKYQIYKANMSGLSARVLVSVYRLTLIWQ